MQVGHSLRAHAQARSNRLNAGEGLDEGVGRSSGRRTD